MRRLLVSFCVLAAVVTPACGDSEGAAFALRVGPQFVNGAVPGSMTSFLVAVDPEGGAPVTLSASATGAVVQVVPETITPGVVAEVRVTPDPIATDDAVVSVAITATRDGVTRTVDRELTIYDWEDDRGAQAGALLDLFLAWLAGHRADLGLTPATTVEGSMVAPGLLVVSHYCFMTEDWEIGLSWHIMLPPDDWAEIYLRPAGAWAPTVAFRLSSQEAALHDGIVEITEVPPPLEVVR